MEVLKEALQNRRHADDPKCWAIVGNENEMRMCNCWVSRAQEIVGKG